MDVQKYFSSFHIIYIVFVCKEWLKRVCASLSRSLFLLLCTKTDFVHRWSFYMYMVTCLFVSLCNHICAFSISVYPLSLFSSSSKSHNHTNAYAEELVANRAWDDLRRDALLPGKRLECRACLLLKRAALLLKAATVTVEVVVVALTLVDVTLPPSLEEEAEAA